MTMQIGAGILPALLVLGQSGYAQDTIVVRADGRPAWGTATELIEEVRIGTLEGDLDYALGSVGGIAVMPSGNIWIGDRHLSAIRRYSAAGRYIDRIGRKGGGPGEFAYPAGMRPLPDGSIAVWDDGQLRVSRFDTSGAFIDSFTPPTHMVFSSIFEEFEVDVDGRLYVAGANFTATAPEGPRRNFWIQMRPDGTVLDTIPMQAFDPEGTVDEIFTSSVLSPRGYLVTARNDRYVLHLSTNSGRPVRIERTGRPVRYEREERLERQRLEEVFAERNGRPARRIPELKPAFYSLKVDSEGRIWVQVPAPGNVEPETPGEQASRERYRGVRREWREPLVYEVLEPNGRYLGRVEFPNRQTDLIFAAGDRVWVVERGPFDEQYVVRYRIQS